jgi:hypothetical protein
LEHRNSLLKFGDISLKGIELETCAENKSMKLTVFTVQSTWQIVVEVDIRIGHEIENSKLVIGDDQLAISIVERERERREISPTGWYFPYS